MLDVIPKLFLLVGSYVFAGRKLNPFPGANAHFNELRHGKSHRWSPSVSGSRSIATRCSKEPCGTAYERSSGRSAGIGRPDRLRRVGGGTCPYDRGVRQPEGGVNELSKSGPPGVSVRLDVGPPPGELRGLQALEEVGLRPALFLNACLRRAHAMGDVRRRADFVGERR
jgi:hypothetical protein